MWLHQAQTAIERWSSGAGAELRGVRLADEARRWQAGGSRWAAARAAQVAGAWRARQAMIAASRQAVVTGRAAPVAADDPEWHPTTAAARIEFHDAPAPVAVRAMPSTPLPEHLWRQWHEPAAERVPHAPPLRMAVAFAVVLLGAVLALSLVTFAAVTHGWHGLPSFGTSNANNSAPLHPVTIRLAATPTVSVTQPPYYIGAWVSDSAPMPTGVVTVYVSVTDATTQAPVAGVPVVVYARFSCRSGGSAQTFGPAATGADGVAAVTVSYSNLPTGQPVCLTATASAGGHDYSADTTFTAAFPPAPTAAPTTPPTPNPGGDGGGGGGGGGAPTPTPTPPGHRKP